MSDTAERIFLPRLPAFKENTFCVDQADTDTVEYIRADLHQKALDHIEELEAKLVRYNEVVGDKINLRAENAELKAKVKQLLEVLELWRDRISGPTEISMQALLHMTDAAILKAKGEE